MPAHDYEGQLIDLIEQTYEAALNPSLWRAVTVRLAHMFGGGAGLVVNDPVNREACLQEAANFDAGYVRSYEDYYGRTNPWVKEFLRLPTGTLLHRGLVPELKLESTEYYCDWLKPQGFRDCLGGVLDKTDTRLSYIAIVRREPLGDFSEHDHRSFQRFVGNMKRALNVHAKLAGSSALKMALFDALDRAGLAAFAVDEDRRLLGHNCIAEALLRSATALQISFGTFATRHSTADGQVARAVKAACRTCQGQTIVLPRTDSEFSPLIGLVMPMTAVTAGTPFLATSGASRCALILLKDPARSPRPDTHVLRQALGLTAAEARLLRDLVSGKSLEEISTERNVRYSTVRAQLRTVMSKTETRRQGELIALATRHTALDMRP